MFRILTPDAFKILTKNILKFRCQQSTKFPMYEHNMLMMSCNVNFGYYTYITIIFICTSCAFCFVPMAQGGVALLTIVIIIGCNSGGSILIPQFS